MKKRIVLATHGEFSKGILSSLEMIAGHYENIEYICAYIDDQKDYQKEFLHIVQDHDYSESNLFVITDLLGGSVNNEFMEFTHDYPFYLITGLNLPLLLQLVTYPDDIVVEALTQIVKDAGEYVMLCNGKLALQEVDNSF